MSYTLHIVSKSFLCTLCSVKKCLLDSLAVPSEVWTPAVRARYAHRYRTVIYAGCPKQLLVDPKAQGQPS